MRLSLEQAEASLLALTYEVAAVTGLRPQHAGFLRMLGAKLVGAVRAANGKPAEVELSEQEFLLLITKWSNLEVGALRLTDAQLAAVEAVSAKLREAHEAAAQQAAEPEAEE